CTPVYCDAVSPSPSVPPSNPMYRSRRPGILDQSLSRHAPGSSPASPHTQPHSPHRRSVCLPQFLPVSPANHSAPATPPERCPATCIASAAPDTTDPAAHRPLRLSIPPPSPPPFPIRDPVQSPLASPASPQCFSGNAPTGSLSGSALHSS